MVDEKSLKKVKELDKQTLESVVYCMLQAHSELIRRVGNKWYVEDSEFGLEAKSVLQVHDLIEYETIND